MKPLCFAKSRGKLHLSAHRGIIQLIPKKDKDPLILKNWRPLTMLTIDYKILAKALAARLKWLLREIISEEQNGFMEKRQIALTIMVTLDIARYHKNLQGYLLSLDFEKCFDWIEYTAIRGSLRYFNFGDEFISWVDLLLTDFNSCTSNNGYFSDYLKVKRSAHQRCPLAPYLFLCCGEVLLHSIKQNSNINGIKIRNLENVIAQFADDTQLFLRNRQAVKAAVSALAEIEKHTSLKVNYEKSNIYTIGNMETFQCGKCLVWDPGKCNILGIDAF